MGIRIFSRVANFYDKLIGEFNFENLREYIPLNKNELLLDLGGGTGRAAIKLEREVNGCIVLDLSFNMLKQVISKSSTLMPVVASSDLVPFRDNTFSQIFVNDSLHHMQKQQKTIGENARIVKKNGIVIIREFDRSYFWNWILIWFEKIFRFKSTFLTPNELSSMFQREDFTSQIFLPSKATYILVAKKK